MAAHTAVLGALAATALSPGGHAPVPFGALLLAGPGLRAAASLPRAGLREVARNSALRGPLALTALLVAAPAPVTVTRLGDPGHALGLRPAYAALATAHDLPPRRRGDAPDRHTAQRAADLDRHPAHVQRTAPP
ncbi:hypothetical protein ACL02R_22575 [Streptomyces sp. MS19]|uniref:hypothetical protein n=1 Tax=Streptomyces sp. MS19 TaxID=3385972 RepID=UPI0039A1D640